MRSLPILLVLVLLGCAKTEIVDEGDGSLTFNRDIAPIIFSRCSSCHRPGQAGPFDLLTYRDVKERASQIVKVTGSRYMPPWPPDAGYGEFVGDRNLPETEIHALAQWVRDGELEGNPDDLPAPPEWTYGWQLGEPDVLVELGDTYSLVADGLDVYRNFVIPIPLVGDEGSYVEAIEFRPDNNLVVHHAVIMLDASGRAEEHDRRDPGLGFSSMDFGDVQGPDGHFLGWTAGKTPRRDPDLAWPLDLDAALVMQLHMLPSGKPEKVRPSVGLFLTDKPPTRQSALVRLSRKDLVIPPGDSAYYIEDRYVLPVDVEVISVYPHAHYLGTLIAAYALLPDGSKEWLIHISDNWDFAWQDEYRFAEPVVLPRGTELVAEFEFDNSSDNPFNPKEPPVTVYYGRGSLDEMADVMLQVVPGNARDLDVLRQHHLEKWLDQETEGLETMLLADPSNWANHHSLAMCYVREGRAGEAITHLEESLRLEPNYAEAHINLGIVLNSQGNRQDAIEHFRDALLIRPDYPDAHYNLGVALFMSGDAAMALTHMSEAARLRPEMAAAIQRRVAQLGPR
jgi:hypothetical protein